MILSLQKGRSPQTVYQKDEHLKGNWSKGHILIFVKGAQRRRTVGRAGYLCKSHTLILPIEG